MHCIGALIEAQSRRRQAATGGESRIPLDAETPRTLHDAGYDYSSVLPAGTRLAVIEFEGAKLLVSVGRGGVSLLDKVDRPHVR